MPSKISLFRSLLLAIIIASSLSLLTAQAQAPKLDDAAIEQRINPTLSQMTLEEKIAQTVHFADSSTGPGSPHADYREQTAQGHVGSFENMTGAAETNALQKIAVESSRLHIPLLFALDVIHGYRTIFPVRSPWPPRGIHRWSNKHRASPPKRPPERASAGPSRPWSISPATPAGTNRRRRRRGSIPRFRNGGRLRARYQGERLNDPQSMLACVKHFVAYGAAEAGRDYNTVDMSERTLFQVYLPPFHAAVDAGAGSIMSAFNSLNGVPSTSNWFTLTHILRQEWGFQGIVISDYGSVSEQ